MKPRLLLCLLALLGVCTAYAQRNVTRSDMKLLTSRIWTNGYDFVQYTTPQEMKENLLMDIDLTPYQAGKRYFFFGGSPNDMGSHLSLEFTDDNKLKVDRSDEYQLFDCDDLVKLDASRSFLLFCNPTNGKVKGVLTVLPKDPDDESLAKQMERDMYRYLFDGSYVEEKTGKTCSFEGSIANGTLFKDDVFTFATNVHGMPLPVIKCQQGSTYYLADKFTENSKDRMKLTPVRYNEDEDDFRPIEGASPILLTRKYYEDKQESICPRYPMLSEQILTATQLLLYAGNDTDWKTTNPKARMQQRLEVLARMRNEIFAVHGYIFQTAKWKNFFGQRAWYKPTNTNVNNLLSPAERINIEHIQSLESKLKKEMEEMNY